MAYLRTSASLLLLVGLDSPREDRHTRLPQYRTACVVKLFASYFFWYLGRLTIPVTSGKPSHSIVLSEPRSSFSSLTSYLSISYAAETSMHFPSSNNTHCFIPMKCTVALIHRFNLYYEVSRQHVLCRCGSIYLNGSPRQYGTSDTEYSHLSLGILAKRGLRWLGSTLSHRDQSAPPPKIGRVCVATLSAWKLHVLPDSMPWTVSFTLFFMSNLVWFIYPPR